MEYLNGKMIMVIYNNLQFFVRSVALKFTKECFQMRGSIKIALFIGLIHCYSGCTWSKGFYYEKNVSLKSTGALIDENITIPNETFVEVVLCAILPQMNNMHEYVNSKLDTALHTQYWLHPERNSWKVQTLISKKKKVISSFLSVPTNEKPESNGSLSNPLVCRTTWAGVIPAGIYELNVTLLETDSTLAQFPGRVRATTPYYISK